MAITTELELFTEVGEFCSVNGVFPRGKLVRNVRDLARIDVLDLRMGGSDMFRRNLERHLKPLMYVGVRVIVKKLSWTEKLTCWSFKRTNNA